MSQSFHRMPLGFGPFPGPRQTAQGDKVSGWDKAKSTTYTVVFRAPTNQLQDLLPSPCFQIEPSKDNAGLATASISFTRLENLPWLAGRGYSLCGLYIHNVVCHGRDDVVRGKYLSVMFENRPDPIISGREELGYAKLFSSLDENENDQNFSLLIGWEGTVFGEVAINSFSQDVPSDPTLLSHLQLENILHYKYIPRTGSPGEADVEYPTMTPPAPAGSSEIETQLFSLSATLKFSPHNFQSLPTLHHITKKLAEIEPIEILGAGKVTAKGADDISSQRPIII